MTDIIIRQDNKTLKIATVGARTAASVDLGPWIQDDVAASQTGVPLALAGGRTEIPTAKGGSVVGIVVYSNAPWLAGTLTVEPTVNGTPVGLVATLDGTNPSTKATVQNTGLDLFAAGSRLGVKVTTSSDWSPTSADITVTLLVEH